jgi:hypothetical protein
MDTIFNNDCPSFQEILEVSKPETSEIKRSLMTSRLEKHNHESELLTGVWLFLSDHNFDYDLLYEFLNLNDYHQLQIKKRTRQANNYTYKFVAAAAILIFGFITFFWYKDYAKSNAILKYAITDIGLPVFASSETESIHILSNEMMSYYKAGKFIEALSCIEKLASVQNDTLNYYAGLVYFNLRKYSLSSERMNLVNKDKTCIFSERAKFVNGLNQVMLGHKDTGKSVFMDLLKSEDNQVNDLSVAILKDESIW